MKIPVWAFVFAQVAWRPHAGSAQDVRDGSLKQNPQLIKKVLRSVLNAHRFIFENREETIRVMMPWLSEPADDAARSHEIALLALSRNGEISDPGMERLTAKKRAAR
jgi:ABC-type nitrate/sulfonate/bicarbonate transport system substrate-binding protein